MRRVAAVVLSLLALASRAAGVTVIDASEAASYVGSSVTVEGDVEIARSEPIGLVLELAPAGPTGVRAILVPSLISSLPRSPERVYQGKRVRVTGLLQRFKGRPELVLESPSQIEIVDVAGAPVSTTTTTGGEPRPSPTATTTRPSTVPAPALAPAPATAPPGEPAPVAPPPPAAATRAPEPAPPVEPSPPAAPAPLPAPEPAPRPLLAERLAEQACERARRRWQDAADDAREATTALTRCLDATTYACHAPAAALAPILAELEWAEQDVADRCD